MAQRKRRSGSAASSEAESSEDEFADATQEHLNKRRRQAQAQAHDDAADAADANSDADASDADGDADADDAAADAQTLEEKRRLRREYRELQQTMEANKSEWVKQHSTGLLDAVRQANALFENVSTTQEAYLDSRLLTSAARLSVVKVNNMKLSGRSLDIGDFLRRVRRALNPANNVDDDETDVLDWTRLHSVAGVTGFAVPTIDFMYGPLAVEPKARKEAKRNVARINKDLSQLQKPQQLKESDIQKQENETSKSVQKIMKVLQKKGPINFFEFVINPGSFSQSVENIFYVSFLIRDGHVSIDIEDGQPVLCPVKPSDSEGDESGASKKQQKQHIVELSYDSWKDIIETYGISETVIPTRAKSDEQAAGPAGKDKWYG